MKIRKIAQFYTLSLACMVFSSCYRQNVVTPPSSIDSTLELPMENHSEKPNDLVPALPESNIVPDLIDGVWNLSTVDTTGISTTKKLISFTFDDAPSRTLENIIAVYADYNESHPDAHAFATVFYNSGLFDIQTERLLAAAHAMRFEFGNHTHSHYDLTTLDEKQLLDEINKTDELLYKIDGKKKHLLRAPFGKTNELVKAVVPAPMIDWSIDTLDWTGASEDAIYHAVFDNRFSGAIVLMHDGYGHTVDAVKRLLPDLYEDGYQVVTISQLAKMHNCTLRQGNVYIRARKQPQ